MTSGESPEGLQLTEEEANALLAMCLTSPHAVDRIAETALRKLANYCVEKHSSNHHPAIALLADQIELKRAGA